MTDEKPKSNLKEYPDFITFRSKKKFKTMVSACLIEGLVLVHYRFRPTANCIKKMSLESFNKRFYEAI